MLNGAWYHSMAWWSLLPQSSFVTLRSQRKEWADVHDRAAVLMREPTVARGEAKPTLYEQPALTGSTMEAYNDFQKSSASLN